MGLKSFILGGMVTLAAYVALTYHTPSERLEDAQVARQIDLIEYQIKPGCISPMNIDYMIKTTSEGQYSCIVIGNREYPITQIGDNPALGKFEDALKSVAGGTMSKLEQSVEKFQELGFGLLREIHNENVRGHIRPYFEQRKKQMQNTQTE